MTNRWKDVGARIRARREALGLTRKQAAHASGVSESQWEVVENARRDNFHARSLRAFERGLGWPEYSIDELLAGREIDEDELDGPAPGQADPQHELNLPPGLSSGNQRVAKQVVAALLVDDYLGGEPTFQVEVLNHLFNLDEMSFWEWCVEELARRAQRAGDPDRLVEYVGGRVEAARLVDQAERGETTWDQIGAALDRAEKVELQAALQGGGQHVDRQAHPGA